MPQKRLDSALFDVLSSICNTEMMTSYIVQLVIRVELMWLSGCWITVNIFDVRGAGTGGWSRAAGVTVLSRAADRSPGAAGVNMTRTTALELDASRPRAGVSDTH